MVQMNKKTPLVSIITPSYNSEKYIREIIESIKNQTYKNVEHIIVDGGSNDSTLKIIKEYNQIKFISEKDKGMYDAINRGLKISKGDIIAWINSDDLYFDYSIEVVVNEYLKSKNNVFVGYCSCYDKNSNYMYTYRFPYLTNNIPAKLGRLPFDVQAVFWTKSWMDTIGVFDGKFKYAGDFDFHIRLFKTNKISTIRKKVAVCRRHEEQLSENKEAHWKEHLQIMRNNQVEMGCNLFRLSYEFIIKLMNFHTIIRRLKKGF